MRFKQPKESGNQARLLGPAQFTPPKGPLNLKPMKGRNTAKELNDLKFQSGNWLVKDLIPRGMLTIVCGTAGCGKSTLMKDLMTLVAGKGETFLRKKLDVQHQSAVFVSTEEGKRSLQMGLRSLPEEIVKSVEDRMVFITENYEAVLKATLEEEKFDLVIIGPLENFLPSGVNDASSVRKIMRSFQVMAEQYDTSIIFIHHLRKSSKNLSSVEDFIGSTGIVDVARSVLALERDGDTYIKLLKINLPSKLLGQKLKMTFDLQSKVFVSDQWVQDSEDEDQAKAQKEEMIARIVQLRKDKVSSNDIPEILLNEFGKKVSVGTVHNWFKEHQKAND